MTRSADDEGYAELPRIPISTRNHQPRQLKSFSHSGDLGDIVYFLPVMRAMGGKLKITRADPAGPPTRQNLLENRAWKTLQELLEYQEYVELGIHLTQVTPRCSVGPGGGLPRDQLEFESHFASEEACRDYLFALRWPEGFRCPRCGHERAWPVRKVWFECARCGRQTSVTAGTIFQDTRKPLRLWFRAMWTITTQKNGASALGLQRVLGLGSYQTAWPWMHKLRRAMVRPGRERLTGLVEVDETYWGAEEEGVIGRQTERKALIAVAAEERGTGLGRIRMQRVQNASAASLMPFVEESVEPGSVVVTDNWSGYDPLKKKDYQRRIISINNRREQASQLLPRVHLAISLLKRWMLGTHQGAVSHEHLDYYLDEFVFRFNRRRSRSRGKLFYRLVQQAMAVEPTPYRSIVADWDAKTL